MKRIGIIGLALIGSIAAAHAESSNLTKAVNFIFKNNENADYLKPVDEANCIFSVNGSTLHATINFNKLYPEETTWITMSEPSNSGTSRNPSWQVFTYVSAKIKGKNFQKTDLGEGDELTYYLGLVGDVDIERHKRAWAYIYGPGGCKPLKRDTPF